MAGKLDLVPRPLPEGHPFKGGAILFGKKRPSSSKNTKKNTSEENKKD